MMEGREFYASTVEEAVEKAAADLRLPAERVEYRILDEGNTGFLGIGARDARIVVDAAPETPEVGIAHDDLEADAAPLEEDDVARAETPGTANASADLFGSVDEQAGEQVDAPEDLLDEVRSLLSTVLKDMGFEAGLEVYDAGGFIAADVTPDNTALFIGQKGETIDALQYLVNVAVYKERPFVKRIVLDAGGYRQRRVEAIQGIAHRTARRAVREHRAVELPPMSSSERRIVHLFLRDNPKVSTVSQGSGDNRRVRILPT